MAQLTLQFRMPFGKGKQNTDAIYNLWINSTCGSQNDSDIWRRLKDRGEWFIPSAGEWGAVFGQFGTSDTFLTALKLKNASWTSSMCGDTLAWCVNPVEPDTRYGPNYINLQRKGWEPCPEIRLAVTF